MAPEQLLYRWRGKVDLLLRHLLKISLLFSFILSTGCGPAHPEVLSADQTSLKDVVAAIAINPEYDKVHDRRTGYVALLRNNGSYSLVHTKGMGLQKLLWTKKGLFFSDYENDYFFNSNGSTGIVTPNRKTYIQNQIIEQKNGKPLATFDEGFDNVSGKPKNILQVFDHTDGTQLYQIVHFPFHTVASCDTGVYGLDLENLMLNSHERLTLQRISRKISDEKGFSIANPDDRFTPVSDDTMPSLNNVVYGIGITSQKEDSYAASWEILKWNTLTGENSFIPIKEPSGKTLIVETSEPFSYEAASLDNGILTFMFNGTGTIYQIELSTGKIIRTVRPDNGKHTHKELLFHEMHLTERHIFTLFTPDSKHSRQTSLRILDRKTLRQGKEIPLQRSLVELLNGKSQRLFQTSFAVNPNYS